MGKTSWRGGRDSIVRRSGWAARGRLEQGGRGHGGEVGGGAMRGPEARRDVARNVRRSGRAARGGLEQGGRCFGWEGGGCAMRWPEARRCSRNSRPPALVGETGAWVKLAGWTRLELATSGVTGRRSN